MRGAILSLGLLAGVGSAVHAQQVATRLGSIDDYLMEERYEIALARSAAPAHVADAARVLVLRRDRYHEARAGTNGFTCLVERSWSSPLGPHEDFFNPKLRAPICYNEEAARTILGDYLRRTELAMSGAAIAEIKQAIETEIGTGALPAPRGLAMSYMLSSGQVLGTETGRFKPHLMFYVPYTTNAQLGSPPLGCSHVCIFEHGGGPFAAVVVPVAAFNDVAEPSARSGS